MLDQTKTFPKLKNYFDQFQSKNLTELFATHTERGTAYTLNTDGLQLDYSRALIDDTVLGLLTELYEEVRVKDTIRAMFEGKHINSTEDRAVLHTALRNVSDKPVILDGKDIMPQINQVLDSMRTFVSAIRNGSHTGYDGQPIKTIVNIGIGGSDLGPRMACDALRYYSDRSIAVRFISNVDPTDFYEQTHDLNPAETLFVIASKTFTTLETMNNARLAKQWFLKGGGTEETIAKHFVALSTNTGAVAEFGIAAENTFAFWDFVGGRYSLMSAIGLSVMIAIGPEQFDELRQGAHSMDEHFKSSDTTAENMPALLALISIWYRNFFSFTSEGVFPYSQYLQLLPSYLQQLVMESNGKSVSRNGDALSYDTAPVIWGSAGTDNQHAYFQMLHQGTATVPADMIGFDQSLHDEGGQHRALLANMHAQADAFAFGKPKEKLQQQGVAAELIAHKHIPGNRPVNVITAEKLSPFALGQLIALYEHKTFVQGQIWGINSFDQFGVELGKEKALELLSS